MLVRNLFNKIEIEDDKNLKYKETYRRSGEALKDEKKNMPLTIHTRSVSRIG